MIRKHALSLATFMAAFCIAFAPNAVVFADGGSLDDVSQGSNESSGHAGSGSNQSGDGSGDVNHPVITDPDHNDSEPTNQPFTPPAEEQPSDDENQNQGQSQNQGTTSNNNASNSNSNSTTRPNSGQSNSGQQSNNAVESPEAVVEPTDELENSTAVESTTEVTDEDGESVETTSDSETTQADLGSLVWIFIMVATGVVALAAIAAFLIHKFAPQVDETDA